MFPCKLILQSLITVPKNLQLYTAATVNCSKLSGHTRANFHNVPCVENCKNGTIKNIFNNTGVGRENNINPKYSSFSIPLEIYKKVRKVNHYYQITKIIHQRSKINILHSKSRNQDTRIPLTVRNGNRIFKHRLQLTQSTFRFISNRSTSSILPPPSSSNSKQIDIPIDSDEIPSYKINVKFNGIIPPPTSRNENVIHDQSKDVPESSFNIRMSKGRKVRPPSGTEKRCRSSGRIIKTSTVRKFNDFNLLKNKESLQKKLKCFIHTTQPLTKKKSIVNNLFKSIKGTKQNEIFYRQHFPNQPFPCSFYTTNDDKIDETQISEFKKNRHFIKSYLRPVNLPPPTPKKLNVQTSNSSLPPIYSLEVMKDLSPSTSIKQETKSPLLDLVAQTKRAFENVQLENAPLPLNLNFPTSEGIQNVFHNEEDPKKAIYLNMQGHDFRSGSYTCLNEYKEPQNNMMNDQMTNENQKSNFESNNAIHSVVSDDYTVGMENKNLTEKSLNNYNTDSEAPSMSLKTITNELNKNNSFNSEQQDSSMYSGTSNTNNTFTSSEAMNSNNNLSNSEEKLENTQDSSIFNNNTDTTWSKKNSLPNKIYASESGIQTTSNTPAYNVNENQENKNNFLALHINNDMSTERNDSGVNKIHNNQENKANFQTFSNMNNDLSSERSDNKISENQETKFNFQAFEISNPLSTKTNDSNVNRMEETKVNFQVSNMNNTLPTEISASSTMHKIDDNQENKVNFQATNMNNTLSSGINDGSVHKIDENQESNVNFLASNIHNTLPTEISNSSVHKTGENQENKVNFQTSNMNNTLTSEISDSSGRKIDENQENKSNFLASNMNPVSTESSNSNVHKTNEQQENKVNFETFGMNNSISTTAMNSNNNFVSAEANYNNTASNNKDSPVNAYFKFSNFINSDIPESVNNLSRYSGAEIHENKVNMQASSGINNTMETMNNNLPKTEDNHVVNQVNMHASSGVYNTMQTMNNNLPKTEENQIGNHYFNEINNNGFNNAANQMTNENMSPSMHTDMINESRIDTPANIPNILSNRFRKPKTRKPEKGLMNSLPFMKNSKGLAELAKSFNHASMVIPKQSIWKKFKFPAPAPSTYNQPTINTFRSMENERNMPKFKNFMEARNYFVQPQNLKKLTPAQIAMYNSILHYENVIKKHSEEMKRQKDNLETTQHALKHRKHKYYKNKSNFDE